MAADPRFSIIMNVYNGERWLHEALASAFAQSFQDWELIFWDDQSTDGSAEILRRFPADPRVRYFYAPEQTPLGRARELAIAQARGEWLAFLDQDDLWTADKLHKQAGVIAAAASEKLAIVYGRAMKFDDRRPARDFDQWHEFGDMPEGDIFESLFVDGCFICQSAVCLKTAAVRAVGGIPAECRFCPDFFFYTELGSQYTAACTQDIVCWYRVHGAAMSQANFIQAVDEMRSITQRWQDRLDPAVYRRRLRIQSTLHGVREITSGVNCARGLRRIARDGSLPYLISRPFAMTVRELRRMWRRALHGSPQRPFPG